MAHYGRGLALKALGRRDESLAAAGQALAFAPNFPPALNLRAEIFAEIGALEGLARRLRSLAGKSIPTSPPRHANRGQALYLMGRYDAALPALNRALEAEPELLAAICNRASVLRALGKPDEALADMERVLSLRPDFGQAASEVFYLRALLCDWRARRAGAEDLKERVRAGQPLIPWEVLVAVDDPEIHLLAAKRFAPPPMPGILRPLAAVRLRGSRAASRRVPFADFRVPSTGHLVAGVF